ncbi:efflux RND transporter periplasmic adaptor subunit [Rouxiella aceris]|nr:efflux RND transporter periplasmic adaptor subunit [Rouxiella aceris]
MKYRRLWIACSFIGATLTVAMGSASAANAPASAEPASDAGGEGVRMQLISPHAVTLSGEIAAKISSLPVAEGESFHRGQPLIEFDCGTYRAQLRKAQAALEAANQLVKVNNQLAKYNSVGSLELTQAKGKAEEAAADTSYMQSVVSKCVITAPFEGRVAKRQAAVYQYANPGMPILDIVDSGSLEIRMLVPSKWLTRLKAGSHFSVTIDELGESFPAKIKQLGAQIDPVSQTILAIGTIDGKADRLLSGMSGWASFK